MIFNPNVFFLAHPPHLIVWNCETHQQFELSQSYLDRLMALIRNPADFNGSALIDRHLFDAGILNDTEIESCAWGWDVLSRLFHMGTKNIPFMDQPASVDEWANKYSEHCHETLSKPCPPESFRQGSNLKISLPTPPPNYETLISSLRNRKTSRNFSDVPVSLEVLASILHYSLAYQPDRESEASALPEEYRYRRTSPSGGGLNATEGYLYVRHVESLASGVYYYNPKDHALELRSALPIEPLGSLLSGQHFANHLAFGIFLTSRLDKLWWKYEHSRAYRMALIEAGHIAQTIQLMATSHHMQTWLTGALNESPIEELLRSKVGTDEVVFFVGAGFGNGNAIPAELNAKIEEQTPNE